MKYILIISLLVYYSAAVAQSLLVKDLETGEPLEGVFLSSGNSKPLSVTDWNGETRIGFFRGREKNRNPRLGI